MQKETSRGQVKALDFFSYQFNEPMHFLSIYFIYVFGQMNSLNQTVYDTEYSLRLTKYIPKKESKQTLWVQSFVFDTKQWFLPSISCYLEYSLTVSKLN